MWRFRPRGVLEAGVELEDSRGAVGECAAHHSGAVAESRWLSVEAGGNWTINRSPTRIKLVVHGCE